MTGSDLLARRIEILKGQNRRLQKILDGLLRGEGAHPCAICREGLQRIPGRESSEVGQFLICHRCGFTTHERNLADSEILERLVEDHLARLRRKVEEGRQAWEVLARYEARHPR